MEPMKSSARTRKWGCRHRIRVSSWSVCEVRGGGWCNFAVPPTLPGCYQKCTAVRERSDVMFRAHNFVFDAGNIKSFRGFAPDPTGGAYSAPPDPLAGAGGGHPLPHPPPSALRVSVLSASRLVSWLFPLLRSELFPSYATALGLPNTLPQ